MITKTFQASNFNYYKYLLFMESTFTYNLTFNNFLYQLLAFFGVMSLVGALVPFSFHYRRTLIKNEMLLFGGLYLFGICLIVIIISLLKVKNAAKNTNSFKLTSYAIEIPKGADELITIKFTDIEKTQLLENKWRGDVLLVKYKNNSSVKTFYLESKAFESNEDFNKFKHLLENQTKIDH